MKYQHVAATLFTEEEAEVKAISYLDLRVRCFHQDDGLPLNWAQLVGSELHFKHFEFHATACRVFRVCGGLALVTHIEETTLDMHVEDAYHRNV